MQELHNYAIWLMVEDEVQRGILYSSITEFSLRYGSEPFVPHMTFLSGKTSDLSKVSALIDLIKPMVLPIDLSIKDLGFSDDYFRTFYLEFENSASLKEKTLIAKEFFKKQGLNVSIPLFPHLSLLYADIDQNKKETLKQNSSFNFKRITFNKLCLAYPENNIWHEIKSWKIFPEDTIYQTK